jgi:hypothetical protein
MDKPFTPTGPTFFVTSTALFIPPQYVGNTLRVVNLAAAGTPQGFAYAAGNVPGLTYTAPAAGAPTYTLQLEGAASEKFSGLLFAQGVTLIASSATGFEVTPGDGQ